MYKTIEKSLSIAAIIFNSLIIQKNIKSCQTFLPDEGICATLFSALCTKDSSSFCAFFTKMQIRHFAQILGEIFVQDFFSFSLDKNLYMCYNEKFGAPRSGSRRPAILSENLLSDSSLARHELSDKIELTVGSE